MSEWEDVEYNPEEWEDVEYVPNILEGSSRSLYQGLEQATRGLEIAGLGGLDYLADALGYEDNAFDQQIKKRKSQKAEARDLNIAGTGYETASDFIEQAAPVLGASVATGGIAAPTLLGLGKGFSDQYQESRDAGQSFSDATVQAGMRGAGEGISNAVEAVPLFKAGSALGRIGKSAIYGAAGNVVSDASDILADSAFKDENNIPGRLLTSAGTGAVIGGGMGTAAEGFRKLGAKTLNKIDDALSEEQISKFDDIDTSQDGTAFNPETLPPANAAENLSGEYFPTIQEQQVPSFPEGYNPEADLGTLPQEIASQNAKQQALEQQFSPEEQIPTEVITGNNEPSELIPTQELQADPLFQQVSNARDGAPIVQEGAYTEFNPYGELPATRNNLESFPERDFSDEILSPEPAKLVQQRQNEIVNGTEQKPTTQMPETPLTRQQVQVITPSQKNAPIQKVVAPGDEFTSPIRKSETNTSTDSPSIEFTEPTTQQIIRLPFEPEVKARTEALITESEEVAKALREARRNSQRGSISLFGRDATPSNVSKARRTKDAAEYDSDSPLSFISKPAKQWFEMFRTTAEKHPEVMPVYRAYSEGIPRMFGTNLIKLRETGSAYFDLPASKRDAVNALLQAQRRKGIDATPEYMRSKGFDDAQVNAALSVRKMMEDSLNLMSDSWKVKTLNRTDITEGDKRDIINAIDTYISGLRNKGYVPDMRFGDYYVEVRDAKGNLKEYAFRQSAREAKQLANEKGLSDKSLKVTHGKRETIPDDVYSDLPADMGGYLFFLEGNRPTNLPRGIMGNFVQARHIDGADKDLTRSIATYIQGVSKYSARAHHEPGVTKIVNQLKGTNPHLASRTQKYIDDVKRPQNGLGSKLWNDFLVPMYNFQYLSGNVSNITLNALEPVMSTYPQIGAHLRDIPTKAWYAPEQIAIKSAVDSMLAPLANKNYKPELRAAVDYAKQSGFLDDSVMREIYDLAKGRQATPFTAAKKLNDIVGFGNRKVEDLVKYYDYITGYNVAKARGLAGKDAFDYAMYFTNDVKSSGRKTEQNALFRNVPVVSLFRNYAANQLRQLNRSIRGKDYSTLARQMLPLFGIAGVQGFPYTKELLSVYDMYSNEGDWKASVRSRLDKAPTWFADAVIYGTPATTLGWVYSNTAGFANVLSPDEGKDFSSRLGKTLLGATIAPFTQYDRAKALYDKGRIDLAIERMAPVSVRQILKARRTSKDGVTDASGRIIKAPSDIELMDVLAAGTNTTSLDLAKRYEDNNLARKMSERQREISKVMNDRIFSAFLGKSGESVEEAINKARAAGVTDRSIDMGFTNRRKAHTSTLQSNAKMVSKGKRGEYLEKRSRIGID